MIASKAMLLVVTACSAPGHAPKQAVDPVVSNDCPRYFTGPWKNELFPACSPDHYHLDLPICRGSTCAPACAMHSRTISGQVHDVTFRYDERGRVVSRTEGMDEVRYNYDGERVASVTFGDFGVTFERDSNDRVIALGTKGAKGRDVPIEYDAKGRITRFDTLYLGYDRRGWLVREGDDALEHDEHGRVTRTANSSGAMTFTYDGDRLLRFGPPGEEAVLDYDSQGRLVSMRSPGDAYVSLDYECK